MARWWKKWAVLAGGLVSVTGWLASASAQVPAYPMPQLQGGGAASPEQLPRLGDAPPPAPPTQPFSMDYRGTPNGFSEDEYYPEAQPYVFKLRGEFLSWHVAMPRLATVVATTASNPNLVNGVGAIADPGTVSLLGPGHYDYRVMSGGRVTGGFALGAIPPIEISGMWINTPSISLLNASSDGSVNSAVLSRPFQAPNLASLNGLGQQVVLSAGFPGILAGTIDSQARLSLWGVETNFLLHVGNSDVAGLDFVLGYRYADLHESFSISNSLTSVSTTQNISFNPINTAGFPPGFTTVASDFFKTHNQFNGATLGIRPSLYVGQFSTLIDLKLAVGATHQSLNVRGESSLLSPDGSVQTVPGGLLAVPSNSGVFGRNAFSVIPELDVNVGFNLTRNIKLFATYNIFAWTNIVRPGDQLSNRIDSRQVPTDATFDGSTQTVPGPSFITRNFWGHGLSVGFEIGF